MDKLKWPTELETGVDVMDEQHRQYFKLVNKYLEKAAELPSEPEQLSDAIEKLEFLHKYAKEHFATEELIMKMVKYEELETHRDEHLYFLQHVEELSQKMKYGSFRSTTVREINFFIVEWFIQHIRLSDMKLAKILEGRSVDSKDGLHFLWT